MTLQPKELFGAATTQRPNLRAYPHADGIRPGTLVALVADADVANLTPLSKQDSTGFWAIWGAATDAVQTITSDGTPATAGDFTLTLDGETTADIAFDATGPEVQTALEGLSNVAVGDVTGVQTSGTDLGDASAVVTLTWQGAYEGVPVTIVADYTGMTGNDHVVASTATGAGADTARLDGFLWAPDEPHAGLLAGETHIQVFRAGLVDARDVVLPAGESQGDLDTELTSQALRTKNIEIQGIAGVG